MMAAETQPTESQPEPPRFQFSLATLLFLCVVLSSSLAVFGGWGIVVFAIVVGIALRLHYAKSVRSAIIRLVLVALILMGLIGLLLSAVQTAREAGRAMSCRNNLHQIVLALLHYEQAYGCFPPAYVADKNGKPMHSWRVLILPYLDDVPLYNAYEFIEPWDGPKNKKLLAARIPLYVCPSADSADAPACFQASYLAVVGPNAAWAGEKPRKLADFPRGGRDTIMVVEAANSGIHWMEPRDLPAESLERPDGKLPALTVSGRHAHGEEFFFTYDRRPGAYVGFADGSVRYLPPAALSAENLSKILPVGAYREEVIAKAVDENWHWNWPNIAALAVWLLSVGILWTRAVRSRRPLSVS